VFYDQKGLASAARGWWLMGLFGHDQAAVLDGGLPKWLREGRPTATGMPSPPKPAVFLPEFRATRLRGVGDVMRNVASGGELVLDARASGGSPARSLNPGQACGRVTFPVRRIFPIPIFCTLTEHSVPLPNQGPPGQAGVDGARPW